MKVLIVEDDRKLGPILVQGMAIDSIAADLVNSGRDAIVRARFTDYAVIVLDVARPAVDELQVCRMLRREQVDTPILILSARNSIADRVHGLESGADDYMGKPFSLRELVARIRAMSRRGPITHPVVLQSGDLRLDSARHQGYRGDTTIDLSRKEFALLEALMQEPGIVLSRAHLLQHVWGYEHENRSNVLEVYIRYLREKIDRPFQRHSLQTIRGVGYRICGEA